MNTPLSRTEFVLSTEGKILQRQITELEKELTAEQLVSLADHSVIYWPDMLTHPKTGPVTIGISKNTMTLKAEITSIRIKTNYIVQGGVMTPAFELKNEPVFDISWAVPGDMRVYFVVELGKKNHFLNAHLLSLDDQKRCYRLPLGNIYSTGNICMGEFESRGSVLDIFNRAFEQFDKSNWNSDLQDSTDVDIVGQLFRFKAVVDGFERLEPIVKWQQVCDTIAPAILNFIEI